MSEKSAEKFPCFNWFARDWIAGTATLTLEQQGAFARLLSYAWEQNPPCTLPDDDRALASLLGITNAHWKKICAPIRRKFEPADEGLIRNAKLYSVYVDMLAHRDKRSRAGQRGNEVRWRSQSDPNAIAMGIANDIAKASPPTPSPKSTTTDNRTIPNGIGEPSVENFTDGELMALVRKHFYAPDGKPPTNWEEGREFSIFKALHKVGISGRAIADRIEGAAAIRDDNGMVRPDMPPVEWLKRGDKMTMRALYNTKSGLLELWTLAEIKLNEISKHRKPTDWGKGQIKVSIV